jgi:hypothetical protein
MDIGSLEATLEVDGLIPECTIDLSGPGPNTLLRLLYCDGSNYKTYRDVVLAGRLSLEALAAIAAKLDHERWCIPGQVGLPDIQNDISSAWYPELDHTQHSFDEIRYTDRATTDGTVDSLIIAFDGLHAWDASYKPPFYRGMVDAYNEYLKKEGADS